MVWLKVLDVPMEKQRHAAIKTTRADTHGKDQAQTTVLRTKTGSVRSEVGDETEPEDRSEETLILMVGLELKHWMPGYILIFYLTKESKFTKLLINIF